MALNSVNTNVGAIIALQSLNNTNTELAATQKQVSTGYRVADAVDDGAAYAVAQRVRSDVGALTSANQQLGNVQGLLSTTITSLNNVSNISSSLRDILVKLADGNTTGNQRTQYQAQYNSDLANLKTFISDSTYNTKSLIGNFGTPPNYGSVNVIRNESGQVYTIAAFNGSGLYAALTIAANITAGAAAALITNTGAFTAQLSVIGTQLNTYGAATNYVNNQIAYNSNKIDSLNSGLGSLVDADLAKESAQLQSLQIRQQLGTQALSLANQAPQTLLSLFK
jgi:flagellin